MRSEAQKKADKRYREKNRSIILEREGRFQTTLPKADLKQINEAIESSGMSKADFLRWAVNKLKEEK